MNSKIYSFELGLDVSVTSKEQLAKLIAERRDRNMPEALIHELQSWHIARLDRTDLRL